MNTQPQPMQPQAKITTPAVERMIRKSYRSYKRADHGRATSAHKRPGRPQVSLSPSDIADRFKEFQPDQRFTTRQVAEVLGVSQGMMQHRRAARTFVYPSHIERTKKGHTTIYYTAGDIVAWGRANRDQSTGKRKGKRAEPRKFDFKKIYGVVSALPQSQELTLQDVSELTGSPFDMLLYRARKKLFAPVHRVELAAQCMAGKKYYLASDVAAWAKSYVDGGPNNQEWRAGKAEVRSLVATYCDVRNVGRKCHYESSSGVSISHMGTEISVLYDMAFNAYNSLLIDFGFKRKKLDALIEKWRKDGATEKKIYGRLIWIYKECGSTRKRQYLDPADVIDWETDEMNTLVGVD